MLQILSLFVFLSWHPLFVFFLNEAAFSSAVVAIVAVFHNNCFTCFRASPFFSASSLSLCPPLSLLGFFFFARKIIFVSKSAIVVVLSTTPPSVSFFAVVFLLFFLLLLRKDFLEKKQNVFSFFSPLSSIAAVSSLCSIGFFFFENLCNLLIYLCELFFFFITTVCVCVSLSVSLFDCLSLYVSLSLCLSLFWRLFMAWKKQVRV